MVWPINEVAAPYATILGSQAAASQSSADKASFNRHPFGSQEAPADQSAPQGQECLVNVSPLFIANAQPPEIQPGEGPFYDPSPSPQPAAMFGVALRQKRDDSSVTETLPD
jgi:hypothetical protein